MMLLKVVPVGTSCGVRIPSGTLASLGVGRGGRLFARVEGDALVLSRNPSHPKVSSFMEAVRPMLGKDIFLLYLYGSFTTSKWKPGKSDIDLYAIARDERAGMRVIGCAVHANLTGGPPIGINAVPLSQVDWVWFEDEVAPGFPLYVDSKAFPRGVPPPEYLAQVGGVVAGAVT